MRIKHFGTYDLLMELEQEIDEFSANVEILNIRYQTIVVNGADRFTAVASYNEKRPSPAETEE